MRELRLRQRRERNVQLTLRSVVIAYVAIDLFESVMRFSMSRLQAVTAAGCVMASLFRVLMAANLSTGFGEARKSCRTARKSDQLRDNACRQIADLKQVGRAPVW